MVLKYFDIYTGEWTDIISEDTGSTLEYNTETGWEIMKGYKKYIAQLTQIGSDVPTAIVLENTLGFIPDWKYDSAGVYGFDWDVDFNSDKCAILIYNTIDKPIEIAYNNTYNITLLSGSNGYITSATIEIRYYN